MGSAAMQTVGRITPKIQSKIVCDLVVFLDELTPPEPDVLQANYFLVIVGPVFKTQWF